MPAAKKTAADEESPLKFATDVRKWMDDAADQVATFLEQAGTPTLGIDAHAVKDLTAIGRVLDEGRRDLDQQLPAPEAE